MAITIGDGYLSNGGAVLEASDGTKVAVFFAYDATGYIEVWKNINGTPSLVDRDTLATIFGDISGDLGWVDAAIDSNNDIHIIASCSSEQT